GGAVDDLVRFVFQAEDGIRDRNVTGVQTCALPILWPSPGEWEPSTGPHSVRSCSPPSPRPCPSGRSTSSGTKQWSEPSSSLPSAWTACCPCAPPASFEEEVPVAPERTLARTAPADQGRRREEKFRKGRLGSLLSARETPVFGALVVTLLFATMFVDMFATGRNISFLLLSIA